MATSELAPVGADTDVVSTGVDPTPAAGRSGLRRTLGIAGQYAVLVALSLLVLGPVLLTVIQALSPPFRYVDAGLPLHPVEVAWKDRTWFTGGAVSVVARTLVVVVLLAWLQKVASGSTSWRTLREPARLGSVALINRVPLQDRQGYDVMSRQPYQGPVPRTRNWCCYATWCGDIRGQDSESRFDFEASEAAQLCLTEAVDDGL